MSEQRIEERIVAFECGGASLWGVLARPQGAAAGLAVLVIVGGPQYRVGSHRQFVQLSRSLAARGYPTLRFDYRGMGDSDGERRSFEQVDDDVQAALDALWRAEPGLRGVVLWGLCDGASAAFMFGGRDPRVCGIVAANPWARDDATLAATHVRHYYGARLMQREFWARLVTGRFDWRRSLGSLASNLRRAGAHALAGRSGAHDAADPSFRARMARGLGAFRGPLLLLLSGNDLTAREFADFAAGSATWRALLGRPGTERVELPESDHTFSRRSWREQAESATAQWLDTLVRRHSSNNTADEGA